MGGLEAVCSVAWREAFAGDKYLETGFPPPLCPPPQKKNNLKTGAQKNACTDYFHIPGVLLHTEVASPWQLEAAVSKCSV